MLAAIPIVLLYPMLRFATMLLKVSMLQRCRSASTVKLVTIYIYPLLRLAVLLPEVIKSTLFIPVTMPIATLPDMH